MKCVLAVFIVFLLRALPGSASSLSPAAVSAIPAETQQIVCVDYRALRASEAAMRFKSRLVPASVRRFEDALRNLGVNPGQELDQITVAWFRTREHRLAEIAVASGQLHRAQITLSSWNIQAKKVSGSLVYAAGDTSLTFLDDRTVLLGAEKAVAAGLGVRDDPAQSLKSNSEMTDQIASVDHAAMWSVLDSSGAQLMVKAMLGDTANLKEYEPVSKKLLAARYALDPAQGADLVVNVITADSVTAATLSTLLKAGILFHKMSASPAQKQAFDDTSVDSDATRLILHFKADSGHFEELFDSPAFAAIRN